MGRMNENGKRNKRITISPRREARDRRKRRGMKKKEEK
jgi:hypothetical protein